MFDASVVVYYRYRKLIRAASLRCPSLDSFSHIPAPRFQILATSSDSKLPLPVQELICNIFDVNLMNQQMREFEIDLQKMPLGKISKDQITKAYKVLTELQALIDKKSSRLQFLDASNRFFTIIPHDFGMNAPPLLDNLKIIKVRFLSVPTITDYMFMS